MRQPFLSISFFIIVLLGSAVSVAYANDNTNTTQHTKTILIRDKIAIHPSQDVRQNPSCARMAQTL